MTFKLENCLIVKSAIIYVTSSTMITPSNSNNVDKIWPSPYEAPEVTTRSE